MMTRANALAAALLAAAASYGLFLAGAGAQHQEQHAGQTGAGQKAATQPAGGMSEMCKMHMEAMSELKDTLAEAKQAADAGDAQQAARKIGEAQKLVEQRHARMHEMMQGRMGQRMAREGGAIKCPMCGEMMGGQGQASNSKCPMDGAKVDPSRLTAATKREYQGQTLGFCCPGCARMWDQLDAEKKQARAKSAQPQQEPVTGR